METSSSNPENSTSHFFGSPKSTAGLIIDQSQEAFEDIDGATLSLIDTVINCILINIVSFFGTIGNVLNIIVLARHGFAESTTILLMAVSVADLVFVFTLFLKRIICVVAQIDPVTAIILDVTVTGYLWIANRFFGLFSSSLVVAISIERFIAVYFPFKVSTLLSPRNTFIIVGVLGVSWVLLLGPIWGIQAVEWSFNPQFNMTLPVIVFSPEAYKNLYQILALNFIISVIRGPISVVVILVCSFAIIRRLRKATRKRSKMTSSTTEVTDVKVVKMLLIVSLVYASIALPLAAPFFLVFLAPKFVSKGNNNMSNLTLVMETCNDLLYVINASINFLIYVTMSSKFYKTYIGLFSCCRGRAKLKDGQRINQIVK
ncbi:FMRFamide receptor-like [Aplysia californica]|uniref:FMRFamide receptor-like n=1 Tax=Aplysia californica TaxID=6500 RepID=A0ABM1VPY8_APLCA|nr:FMRFamide receptor-like [Aplysia californica]